MGYFRRISPEKKYAKSAPPEQAGPKSTYLPPASCCVKTFWTPSENTAFFSLCTQDSGLCALARRMTRTRRAPLPTSSKMPPPRRSIEHMSPPLQASGGRTSWLPSRAAWSRASALAGVDGGSTEGPAQPAQSSHTGQHRPSPAAATRTMVTCDGTSGTSVLNEVYGAPPSPWTHACGWWAARE